MLQQLNKVACKECQRRKVKCSRELPVCTMCSRYQRDCSYDMPQKTPLTRKYLTEIERELLQAKVLLQHCYPDLDVESAFVDLQNGRTVDQVLNGHSESRIDAGLISPTENSTDTSGLPQVKPEARILSVLNHSGMVPRPRPDSNGTNASEWLYLQIPQFLPPAVYLKQPYAHKEHTRENSPFAASPARSYDWDERKLLRHDSRPTIIDGMATTVSNSYLGLTSSAALLSLVGVGYFLNPIQPSLMELEFLRFPERKILEGNINKYFDTYHVSYPIVHRALFLAYFNEIVPPPPCWKSLLNIVAAIGSFMAATSADDHADLILFDRAKLNLSMEDWETGNLTLVQTLALMASYLQLRDRPNSGYNYLGIAVRMAMGLGFHKDMAESSVSLFDQEVRRRVWWCLYVFDCSQTITYGRPLGLSCNGVDAPLPMNIVDSSMTASTTVAPQDEKLVTIYTSLRLQALFHLLTNGIYERIISEPLPSAQALLQWDTDYLQRWKSHIPDYYVEEAQVPLEYRLSHAVIHWRYRNLRIIIYRLFVLRRQVHGQVLENDYEWRASIVCLDECRATIASMEHFWTGKSTYHRMDAWLSLYFLIPAVMMPLVCLRNDPLSLEANRWRNDVVMAQGIILKIMAICPPALRILELINKVGAGCLSVVEEASATYSIPKLAPEEDPISQLMQLHLMLWPDSM